MQEWIQDFKGKAGLGTTGGAYSRACTTPFVSLYEDYRQVEAEALSVIPTQADRMNYGILTSNEVSYI